ncbi:unnamed protein product, partial [Linum tenue]
EDVDDDGVADDKVRFSVKDEEVYRVLEILTKETSCPRKTAKTTWKWVGLRYMIDDDFIMEFSKLKPKFKDAYVESIIRYNILIVPFWDVVTNKMKRPFKRVKLVKRKLLRRQPLEVGGYFLDTDSSIRNGYIYVGLVLRNHIGRVLWTHTVIEHNPTRDMIIHPQVAEQNGIFLACRALKEEKPNLVKNISE